MRALKWSEVNLMVAHYDADGKLIPKKRATVKGMRAKLATEKRKREVAEAKLDSMEKLIGSGWQPRSS